MAYSQESRVSSTQDNFRLSEESRSSVSALVSRLNSSALGVDHYTDNVKLRGDTAMRKGQKMQDPFPWMGVFCNLCQAAVGSRNIRNLENLMEVYLENVTPSVMDCYSKPNRAAKLKKGMIDTLMFFHLFYQEIKETLEHSCYLEKMTPLVSMFMDMEMKASSRGKESLKKVASRLTSSLYIFLDNSEEHMLDAMLMTKFVHKNYREICHPLLLKLLSSISTYPISEMMYVRCLLTFKLWKKVITDSEERRNIYKMAVQKLHTSPNLITSNKGMENVLPRIPKSKMNTTLFLMQSNFDLKNACQEFLKLVKKQQKNAQHQGLDVEIGNPLFFVSRSGDSSPRLTEKENERDSGNMSIDDLWSSVSTMESSAPQTRKLSDLTPEQPSVVESQETCKKNKKAEKKKGKKQKVVKCVENKKKKKVVASSEKSDKQAKKLSKLKGKKKKKKMQINGDNNQNKSKQVTSKIEDCTQVTVQPSIPTVGEHNQIRDIKAGHLRADSSLDEESQKLQIKQASSNLEENVMSKEIIPLPQIRESEQEVIQAQGKKCNKPVDQQSPVEEHNLTIAKKNTGHTEEFDKITSNQVSSMIEEFGLRNAVPTLPEVESVLKVKRSEELKTTKNNQFISKADDVSQSKAKNALMHRDDSIQGKPVQASPHMDEYTKNKSEQTTAQLEDSDLLYIKQAFLHIGGNDKLKFKQAMLQIGEYDEVKIQKVMEQHEASEATRVRQALYQFKECDEQIRETKIEPQLEIPKMEKCDSPPSVQSQESEISNRNLEPLVKKVKVELIANVCADSSFEAESSVPEETMSSNTETGGMPSEKTLDCAKPHALPKESVLALHELNSKCVQSEKTDNSRRDLFTVDSSKDSPREKDSGSPVNAIPVPTDEEKPNDLSQKTKTSENSVSVPIYSVIETYNYSLKQETCDNSETADASLDANKTVQIDSYSDVEIVDEPQEAGKCDVFVSEREIVLDDDGDLLPQQSAENFPFVSRNEDVVNEVLMCSEKQFPMSRDVLTEGGMEFDTNNSPVGDDLEPGTSSDISGHENSSVDSFYPKTKYNPNMYYPHSYVNIDWIEDRNNAMNHYEMDKSFLPKYWLAGEEDDEFIEESDMSKSFDSTTPKRGMGKMSYQDVVLSCNQQEQLRTSTSVRHSAQGYLMMNSSESESSSTETSTPNTSGLSSPRSESAIGTVDAGAQENIDRCGNTIKHSDLNDPCERVPDVTNMRYYNSNYPKSPDVTPCAKGVSYSAQVSFTSRISSHHMDNAHVVVETMEDSVLNHATNDRLTATSSKPETSSKKNSSETISQHSPLKRKKSSKLPPEQTVDSHSSPGKHETGEAGNYAAQSRATVRGRGRRGRPPSRGRGVSSSCKLSSDSKSTRKHGCSGKGRNDPEFQISSSKKSQQYDPPLTRSISKKFGISETANMFDHL